MNPPFPSHQSIDITGTGSSLIILPVSLRLPSVKRIVPRLINRQLKEISIKSLSMTVFHARAKTRKRVAHRSTHMLPVGACFKTKHSFHGAGGKANRPGRPAIMAQIFLSFLHAGN